MIYFMERASDGLIKIGCSAFPEYRRQQIANTLKTEVLLLACHEGSFGEEKILHNKYASQRVIGEWFKPSDALWDEIADIEAMNKPLCCDVTLPCHPHSFALERIGFERLNAFFNNECPLETWKTHGIPSMLLTSVRMLAAIHGVQVPEIYGEQPR